MRIRFKRRRKRPPMRTWYGRRLAVEDVEARLLLSANTELPITTVSDDNIASIGNAEFVDVSTILFAEPLLQDRVLRSSWNLDTVRFSISADSDVLGFGSGANVIFSRSANLVQYQNVFQFDGQASTRNIYPAQVIQPITPGDLAPTPVAELPVQTANATLPISPEPTPTEKTPSTTFDTVPRTATAEPAIELVDITMTLFESTTVDPLIPDAEPTVATHDLFFAKPENGRRTIPVSRFFIASHATVARSQDWQLDSQGSRGRAQAFEIIGDTLAEAEQREILPTRASREARETTQPSPGSSNMSPDLVDVSATNARQSPMFLPIHVSNGPYVESGATTEDKSDPPLRPKRPEERTSSTSSVKGAFRTLTVISGLVFSQGWWASEKRIAQDDIGPSHRWRLRKQDRVVRDV